MKRIAVLGSTGSIGENALRVAEHLPDELTVTVLAAGRNIDRLEEQAKRFRPKLIAVFDADRALELQSRLPDIEIVAGIEGLCAAASHPEVDFVVSSVVGTIGLQPTLAALDAGKDVGLANKEALISGGALVMDLAKKRGKQVIPIDSEHSALFQCLQAGRRSEVKRLILTASGGPFRDLDAGQLKNVTVEQALKHPNWSMGAKVTIDSSTLMNKGLEVIEAHWLFDMPLEHIDVIVHPQSIVHSMVEYVDNSLIAHMGEPTMIVPIQYALTYPERREGLLEPFDFTAHGRLDFYPPDTTRFRCLALAFEALRVGGSLPGFMNAANEVLVERFLDKQIGWSDIATRLEQLMKRHQPSKELDLETVLEVDRCARCEAAQI